MKTTHVSEIWPSCGYPTLAVQESGNLELTRDFLQHLLHRPELALVDESCEGERALHHALLEDPRLEVMQSTIEGMADADARENYRLILDFRDYLDRHPNLESAYYNAVASDAAGELPGPLVDLLVQAILRHLLQPDGSPFHYRAAELFFRTQKASLNTGLLLADSMTLEQRRHSPSLSPLERLVREAQGTSSTTGSELEVLGADNASQYPDRSEDYDFALDLALSGPGMAALCEIIARWLEHFHGVRPKVTAVNAVDSKDWRWHIGLDRESNAILNALYRDQQVSEQDSAGLIALFRMDCPVDGFLDPRVEGRPIYLGLAMDSGGTVRLKPQNLIHNLPLATRS